MAFYIVYIREAHPEEGWILTANRDEGIEIHEPASDDQRVGVAQRCAIGLRIRLPVLVDGVDDAVGRQYGGWPDRLYLIGKDGRVAFQGDPGPVGFKPALLEMAIERELGSRR